MCRTSTTGAVAHLETGKFRPGDVVYGGQCRPSLEHCKRHATFLREHVGDQPGQMTMFIVSMGPDGVCDYFRDEWVGLPGVRVVGRVQKPDGDLVEHVPYFGLTDWPSAVQRQGGQERG